MKNISAAVIAAVIILTLISGVVAIAAVDKISYLAEELYYTKIDLYYLITQTDAYQNDSSVRDHVYYLNKEAEHIHAVTLNLRTSFITIISALILLTTVALIFLFARMKGSPVHTSGGGREAQGFAPQVSNYYAKPAKPAGAVKKWQIAVVIILIALTLMSAISGVFGIMQISRAGDSLYNDYTYPMQYLTEIKTMVERIRANALDMVIFALYYDMHASSRKFDDISNLFNEIDRAAHIYRQKIKGDEAYRFDEAWNYYNMLKNNVIRLYDWVHSSPYQGESPELGYAMQYIFELDMVSYNFLRTLFDLKNQAIYGSQDAADNISTLSSVVLIFTLAFALLISALLIFLAVSLGIAGKRQTVPAPEAAGPVYFQQ